MPPATLIELDVSTPWEPPEPPLRRRHVQRWLAVGLALAGLFALLGGSQRARSLDPVATIKGDGLRDVRYGADRLYVLRQADSTRVDLEAYRLRDGARLWGARLESPAEFADIVDDRVLINGGQAGATQATVVIALDAATGAEVWRRPGYAPAVPHEPGHDATLVMDPFLQREEPGAAPPEPNQRVRQFVGLDVRTGAQRWSLTTPPGTLRSFLFVDPGRDDTLSTTSIQVQMNIGELAPDGTLTVHSTVDGAVIRTAKIDLPPQVDGFEVVGERLIAYEAGQDIVPTGEVYDLRTGHRLWPLPTSAESGPVWACRPVLCSGTESSIAVLDPDTGRVRWQLDKWVGVQSFGGHMLAMRIDPSGNTEPGAMVLDTASGKVLHRVDGWEPIGPEAWPDLIVTRRNVLGKAVIGRMDIDTGAVTVFGRADRWFAPPDCFIAQTFLVCRAGTVSIWRLPS